jgi:hypothetical protein
MSEGVQTTLFFIKNPSVNLLAIELYLKKRGFQVFSESDLKTAFLEIMKISPHYIFLAWDHPSDRMTNLPKFISQSMMTTMIAYCTSNDKNQLRKLQSSGQTHKLFPPLSGPAIQRLISKLEKENTAAHQDPTIKKSNSPTTQNQTDNVEVRSEEKDKDLDQFMNTLSDSQEKSSEIYFDRGQRAQELRNKQGTSNVMFLSPVQDIVSSNEHKMTDSLKQKFDQEFDQKIKLPLEEIIETLVDSGVTETASGLKNETLEITKYGYCVVVEHSKWNGYLIVASEATIDPLSLESVLSNWINENLEDDNSSQAAHMHGFEISLSDISYESFSEKYADYTKTIIHSDSTGEKKTVLSFFSVAPEMMLLHLHSNHDMIEILTNEVPISLPVPFDLHLYLPENKKFILYSKKNSSVANIQIDRLKEKKVDKLFSSLDFENKVQKFRAEKRIDQLIQKYKDLQKK